jgi:hypothetical protein
MADDQTAYVSRKGLLDLPGVKTQMLSMVPLSRNFEAFQYGLYCGEDKMRDEHLLFEDLKIFCHLTL